VAQIKVGIVGKKRCVYAGANVQGVSRKGEMLSPVEQWSALVGLASKVYSDLEVESIEVTDGEYQLALAWAMSPEKFEEYLARNPLRHKLLTRDDRPFKAEERTAFEVSEAAITQSSKSFSQTDEG